MKIHISRGGERLGQFSKAEVDDGLRDGRFSDSDLAWTEGMAEWESLGTLISRIGGDGGAGVESGIEWEHARTSRAFLQTVKEVLFSPQRAFQGLSNSESYWRSYAFFVLCFGLGGMVTMLYGAVLGGVAEAMVSEEGVGDQAVSAALTHAAAFPFYLCMGALVPFVGAGVNHLCLMLVGGAKRPFSATMKSYCYANGASSAFLLIPLCGGVLGGAWGLCCNIIGLAEVHGIGRGRAAAAVLLPVIGCCSAALALWALMTIVAAGGIPVQ